MCYITDVMFQEGVFTMPPRARITREMLIDAGFEIARVDGAENINARAVAGRLGCSTQPVMYHFATVDDLKRAVYVKADQFHSEYLMREGDGAVDPLLNIGLNYIRFAIEEPNLFRFLFQSGYATEGSVLEMIDSEELAPVLGAMQAGTGLGMEKTKEVFLTLALFVHGYASIIANNALEFDEAVVAQHLERVYEGAMLSAQKGEK